MKKGILLLMASLLFIGFTQAQKIKVESGDLAFLKGLAELNVQFVYPDDMVLGKLSQQEYMDKKMKEAEEKEPGTSEKWKENYYADRTHHFEPQFILLLGEYTGELYIDQDNSNYEYTMIVKTTFIEPGFNVGITSKAAAIDLDITFVKTASPEEILGKITISKAPGTPLFDFGLSVGEAYAKAGKELGKLLEKKYL